MSFEIKPKIKSKDTLTRTIRFSGKTYDKIEELAQENNITFNNLVNQIVNHYINDIIND